MSEHCAGCQGPCPGIAAPPEREALWRLLAAWKVAERGLPGGWCRQGGQEWFAALAAAEALLKEKT